MARATRAHVLPRWVITIFPAMGLPGFAYSASLQPKEIVPSAFRRTATVSVVPFENGAPFEFWSETAWPPGVVAIAAGFDAVASIAATEITLSATAGEPVI